ncbi:MAG: hypothetical protein QOG15_1026 [Solirubrobacteraceae bacterium]|nr:hypothetical protein [Solirubrobacteraceae bacterium]
MPSRDRERGQATVDYTSLLAVVVVVLAGVATLVPGAGNGIANAVSAQTARAICIVSGRSCPVDPPRPCSVTIRRETRHYGLNLALVRLDKHRFLLRELLSDGTVRLTLIKRYGAGLEIGAGARVQVDEEDLNSGGLRRELKLGGQGVRGTGKVYYARNAREADLIQRALEDGDPSPIHARDTIEEGGLRGMATLATGSSVGGLDFDWTSTRLLAVRHNRQTGENTISLSLGDGGSAVAASIVGGPTGALDGTTTIALTLDRDHRPTELSLLSMGVVSGGAKLSKALSAPLALTGQDDVPSNIVGRRWEFAARVALTDPEVAAAWKRFLQSPASLAAIRALARVMRERAYLDVRTYRMRSSANGTSIGLSAGLKIGGETDRAIDRFNLLAASSRPPGGLWEPRLDCV